MIATSAGRVGRKLVRAWQDGTLANKANRWTLNLLYVPAVSLARDSALPHLDRVLDLSHGFEDHRGTDREVQCSEGALRRLVRAFKAAEDDAVQCCPPDLAVRGLWAEWLALNFGPLREALRGEDLAGLRKLLENMHRHSVSTGVGGTADDVRLSPAPLARAYYRSLWCAYRDLLEAVRPDWRDVASPVVGNPQGVWLDGRLVQIETLRHAHHATVLLERLSSASTATVLEIGAGMGGQAYQFVALGSNVLERYTIVDLPEVACLAGYFLIAALGDDRVRLYGEAEPDGRVPVVEVLPHWAITGVEPMSASLVFNAHSFSEMDGASAVFYLREIERLGNQWFFHVNHERRFRYRTPGGGQSVNRVGSEMVPSPEAFELVERRPQAFRRPENRGNTGFEYLYRRVR